MSRLYCSTPDSVSETAHRSHTPDSTITNDMGFHENFHEKVTSGLDGLLIRAKRNGTFASESTIVSVIPNVPGPSNAKTSSSHVGDATANVCANPKGLRSTSMINAEKARQRNCVLPGDRNRYDKAIKM